MVGSSNHSKIAELLGDGDEVIDMFDHVFAVDDCFLSTPSGTT
jgi:hypothetical protein